MAFALLLMGKVGAKVWALPSQFPLFAYSLQTSVGLSNVSFVFVKVEISVVEAVGCFMQTNY